MAQSKATDERAPARLSPKRILAAAHEIAEREGLAALSMRRLAQELDVWPMSIYRHFADKDALLDAMAASAAGDVSAPSPRASWRTQITRLLEEAQRSIARSSELGRRLPRAFLSPAALGLTETAIGILTRAGFSEREAARAWRALWSYTFGFATFRLAPTPNDAAREVRMATAALPENGHPALASASGELAAALSNDDEFAYGLERLLDGLEAALS
jgi:TetR/AcrR family transcriptional regulator, tetracycline repressor protein